METNLPCAILVPHGKQLKAYVRESLMTRREFANLGDSIKDLAYACIGNEEALAQNLSKYVRSGSTKQSEPRPKTSKI